MLLQSNREIRLCIGKVLKKKKKVKNSKTCSKITVMVMQK